MQQFVADFQQLRLQVQQAYEQQGAAAALHTPHCSHNIVMLPGAAAVEPYLHSGLACCLSIAMAIAELLVHNRVLHSNRL